MEESRKIASSADDLTMIDSEEVPLMVGATARLPCAVTFGTSSECPDCGTLVAINERYCPACTCDMGAPNVLRRQSANDYNKGLTKQKP